MALITTPNWANWDEDAVGENHPSKADTVNRAPKTIQANVELLNSEIRGLGVNNLKPVVNAAVNKLDIFTKSGGAVPDADNPIEVFIPDGSGNTLRSRAASYFSGTSQFILADAVNYWSKGMLADEIKTAWLYAIWDGTGIVWALAGYAGFNVVPTTTTVTADDYFLLEGSSTYTRDSNHLCVCVGKIRYEYNTADTPDHTIQAGGENVPQVIWNPKSDYSKTKVLAANVSSATDIFAYSLLSHVVNQSGLYEIILKGNGCVDTGTYTRVLSYIKVGSAVYVSAVARAFGFGNFAGGNYSEVVAICFDQVYLNKGETIHGGVGVYTSSGNRYILATKTKLFLKRID